MRTLWLTLAALTLLLAAAPARALEIPDFTPNVVDPAGVLDDAGRQAVNAELARIREQSHIWGAVFIVDSLDGEPIENVAVQAFEKWQLGQKGVDNGLLLVLAMHDRESRFEVGYGLEGPIPDVVALHALDDHLAPKMRAGDPAGAIIDAFAFLSRVVAGDPAALEELSVAQAADGDEDWRRGWIAWGVFTAAMWLGWPASTLWPAWLRARLNRREPGLLAADEGIATAQGKSKGGWTTPLFLLGFFTINPGAFVLILSAQFATAFYVSVGATLLIVLLVVYFSGRRYASPQRYRAFLNRLARQREDLIRKGHLEQDARGDYAYTPAYHASRASSSSSSGSSGSSSSSGGGRSGGGGASSRW